MSAKLGLAKHKFWKTRYIHWDREKSSGTSVASAMNELYFHLILLIWEFPHPNQFNLWHNSKRDGCTCNGSTYLLSERKCWEYHKDVNDLFIVLNAAHSNRMLPWQRRQLRHGSQCQSMSSCSWLSMNLKIIALMIGHQLGSFETRVMLLEDESKRVGELGGRITIAFMLDILQSGVYIAEVGFEGCYLIDRSKCFHMNSSRKTMCIQGYWWDQGKSCWRDRKAVTRVECLSRRPRTRASSSSGAVHLIIDVTTLNILRMASGLWYSSILMHLNFITFARLSLHLLAFPSLFVFPLPHDLANAFRTQNDFHKCFFLLTVFFICKW